MKLAELQTKFADYLLYKDEIPSLNITGPFSSSELMQLYRNNFYISISDYLKACFPSVEALVGEEFFEQLAKAFILDEPLSCASIELYGEAFSNFIENSRAAESVPYLAGVARLDWASDRAKTVDSLSAFPFSELEKLTAEEQVNICFETLPMTTLIESPYPILAIWEGVKTGQLENIDLQESSSIVVYPNVSLGVQCLALSNDQYEFLNAVKKKEKLHQLAEMEGFQQQLSFFIEKQIINKFTLSE